MPNVGPGNADVVIVKTGSATVASGGSMAYTLTISNHGASPANGASYVDNVPTGITAITGVATTVTGAPGGEMNPVPVDACWMLALMTLMLMLVGALLAKRRR